MFRHHRIAGIVWDLGNVLIRWEPAAAIAAALGEEEARRFLGAEDFDFFALNHRQDAGGTWAEAEAEVRRTHPHWAEHVAAYREHFAASIADPVPGTAELVRTLHEAGVPQWGLTNWSHELFPHAGAAHDVLDLLDGIVVSGTERVAKPDPRIYRLLAERSGLPLDGLVFVDDSPANVTAARELGMDGILFTGAADLRAELAARDLPVPAGSFPTS